MENVFARLEDLSAKLNYTSDTVSDALKRLEAKLATLRLGVVVWLDEPLETFRVLDAQGKSEDEITVYLGYAKVSGTWHLATKHWSDRWGDDGTELFALQQAPREHRVAALKRIPELISTLEKKAEEEAHQIQLALDSVFSLAPSIVNTKPKP